MIETARIVIEGIGVVGGFGCGIADLSQGLSGGARRPGSLALSTPSGPVDVPAFRADPSRLKEFVPARTLRRIDHYSRLGILGGFLALEDAGLPEAERRRLGIIVASGYGATGITYAFLRSFIRDGDIFASPTHFANSVHNSAAANISILLGAAGPCLTVSQFDLSVPSALVDARRWLAEGRVDRVLFGAVEELSELIGYVWLRERGMPHAAVAAPLQTGKDTAIPAEGAAFFLLSREADARKGYCTLDAVTVGGSPDARIPLPDSGWLVLGADGRRETGRRYAAAAERARVACYTPLYGSMPAGPAFDIAAAALAVKEGWVFPLPGDPACDFPATLPAAGGEPLGDAPVSCLALADDDAYGLTRLGRFA